jgi:ATP-dependent protease ClpP protease subunit/phage head maturation protease
MESSGSAHVRRLESRVSRTTARLLREAARGHHTVADLPTLRLPWYEVRDQGGGPGGAEPATVLIYDEIGGSFGVSAKAFVKELDAITAPVIHLRINSPGGSLFDAIAIYNALHHHPSRVVVYVDSLAASAASLIAMGGDEVVMMPGSQLMIHDAAALEDGNAADMAKMATFLDRQSDNVADIYRLRGGGEVSEWRGLMLAETWMFAQEAVDFGLADRVEPTAPVAAAEDDQTRTRTFDLSQFRYAGRADAPAPMRRHTGTLDTTTARRSQTTTEHRGATMTVPSEAMREAAEARKAAARRDGTPEAQFRLQAPCGSARTVSTEWFARGPQMPLPQRLRAQKVERDGKPFFVVEGYATVYERGYEMWDWAGPYTEIVSAGAADETLAANPDVVFLVNHKGLAMARTIAGTLDLWSDDIGMGDRAWLNPGRADVKDLVLGIDDGVITEQSFAFMITSGQWSPDYMEYRINKFDVNRGDTSAVNYGANPATSIAARSREILDALDHLPAGAARVALQRLTHRSDLAQMTPPAAVREPQAPLQPVSSARSVNQVDSWLAAVAAG